MTERERHDWALNDRSAKALIGAMLALQIVVLVALIWL